MIHGVYYGFILTLLPCLTLCVVFQSFCQAYYKLTMMPQNYGSLKSMEGLPLTTLCVRVSDPTGINDGTLCSLSITTILREITIYLYESQLNIYIPDMLSHLANYIDIEDL